MAKTRAQISADYRAKDIDAYRARKAALARTPEHKAVRTEYMRKWREENREAFNAMCNASHKRHRVKNKDSVRNDHYMRKYGITLADFNAMVVEQDGKCKICSTKEPKGMGTWHVDHCHDTKKVRGLLCSNCNTKLGWHERFQQQIEEYLNGKR